uniref:Uncharacterized protein n=1 Tax=Kwoniella dejecticola CBS 10117 TaxID=1296121 RepID=A0A1A6A816_9TREE|nr:uncharacterized protein I303_03921 [Kwoniella dejecticola CBS 10117]OBR86201.1 hypothetical protein I303_03921 [Kwoniella dejecticola CBS 10117]
MGAGSSKPALPLNALHFRVYSFQNHDSYDRCLEYAGATSDLVGKIAVTQLTDDLTFIACYRVTPYKRKDINLICAEVKTFLGPQYNQVKV